MKHTTKSPLILAPSSARRHLRQASAYLWRCEVVSVDKRSGEDDKMEEAFVEGEEASVGHNKVILVQERCVNPPGEVVQIPVRTRAALFFAHAPDRPPWSLR